MEPLKTLVGVEAFGARIAVRAPESIASALTLRLPPQSRRITGPPFDTTYTVQSTAPEAADGTAGFDLSRDGEPVGWFAALDRVRFELESDMHFRVATGAREFLFVHAGVVEIDGRAVLMPGRTLVGKSSLVMALVGAGATYYSDEYAVVDRHGKVHAYRKPLSERVDHRELPKLHPSESLGAVGDASALPVGLIVITRFRPEGRWRPEPVTRADALMALFDNTVLARERSEFALDLLARAVETATGVKSERGEADQAASGILDAMRPPRG